MYLVHPAAARVGGVAFRDLIVADDAVDGDAGFCKDKLLRRSGTCSPVNHLVRDVTSCSMPMLGHCRASSRRWRCLFLLYGLTDETVRTTAP